MPFANLPRPRQPDNNTPAFLQNQAERYKAMASAMGQTGAAAYGGLGQQNAAGMNALGQIGQSGLNAMSNYGTVAGNMYGTYGDNNTRAHAANQSALGGLGTNYERLGTGYFDSAAGVAKAALQASAARTQSENNRYDNQTAAQSNVAAGQMAALGGLYNTRGKGFADYTGTGAAALNSQLNATGVLGSSGTDLAGAYFASQAGLAGQQMLAQSNLGSYAGKLSGDTTAARGAMGSTAMGATGALGAANQNALANLSVTDANRAIGQANAYGQENVSNRNFLGQMEASRAAIENAMSYGGGTFGGGGFAINGPDGEISSGSYDGGGSYGGGGRGSNAATIDPNALLAESRRVGDRLYSGVDTAFANSRREGTDIRNDVNRNYGSALSNINSIRDLSASEMTADRNAGMSQIDASRNSLQPMADSYSSRADAALAAGREGLGTAMSNVQNAARGYNQRSNSALSGLNTSLAGGEASLADAANTYYDRAAAEFANRPGGSGSGSSSSSSGANINDLTALTQGYYDQANSVYNSSGDRLNAVRGDVNAGGRAVAAQADIGYGQARDQLGGMFSTLGNQMNTSGNQVTNQMNKSGKQLINGVNAFGQALAGTYQPGTIPGQSGFGKDYWESVTADQDAYDVANQKFQDRQLRDRQGAYDANERNGANAVQREYFGGLSGDQLALQGRYSGPPTGRPTADSPDGTIDYAANRRAADAWTRMMNNQ